MEQAPVALIHNGETYTAAEIDKMTGLTPKEERERQEKRLSNPVKEGTELGEQIYKEIKERMIGEAMKRYYNYQNYLATLYMPHYDSKGVLWEYERPNSYWGNGWKMKIWN